MSLKRRAARALFWATVQTWTGLLFGFFVLVVLGRLLGPEPYGLIAIALIVIAFGELFVIDSGFGDAIIQRKELSDDHCDAAFWLLLGASLIAMTILVLGAPLVAAPFDEPGVAGLIGAKTTPARSSTAVCCLNEGSSRRLRAVVVMLASGSVVLTFLYLPVLRERRSASSSGALAAATASTWRVTRLSQLTSARISEASM